MPTGTMGTRVLAATYAVPSKSSLHDRPRLPRAFGEHHERLARLDHRDRGSQGLAVGRAAVHRERAERVEERVEGLELPDRVLAHVPHAAGRDERHEREVDVRAVHGREDERPVARDVLAADDLDAAEQLGHDEDEPAHEAIERELPALRRVSCRHRASSSTRRRPRRSSGRWCRRVRHRRPPTAGCGRGPRRARRGGRGRRPRSRSRDR